MRQGKSPSFRYTDEYTGDSTDLLYLRARYYATGQGRFLTRDTWAGIPSVPITYNHWAYAHGNPVMLTDPNGKDPLAECIALLGALAVADGPLPVGDTAGLIACAAIFIGGSYTALWVTQQIPQVQQELGQCTITWQYLYTRVQPQPKKGPIKIPWWPTDNDDKKQKIKDISLGLAEVGPQPALFMFTTALNAKLNRINVYVYSNKDWFKEGLTDEVNPANFYLQFNQATQRASKIHFNLQGIDDPVAYANNMGATGFGDSSNYFTAVELYQIKESPALCQKTSFYKDASHSLIPSQSLKNLLC